MTRVGEVISCLRAWGDAEQFEAAGLDGRGLRIEQEVVLGSAGESHDVAGEDGELAEQGVEAVHRRSIIGAFAGGLAAGRQGTMRISARPRRRIVLWRVRLPCALPNMFAGLKVAISLALVGAIVGEFVASSRGLGYMIMTAEGTFDTSQIFAAITMLRIVGVIPFQIVEITERRLIPSHSSQRGR